MKRIIGFFYKNFAGFVGFPEGLRVELMEDFFIEVQMIEGSYYLLFSDIKIDRYATKEPILILKSSSEDEILQRFEKILTDEAIFRRILKENLDKFRVIGNG
jgi:hypothetical protein